MGVIDDVFKALDRIPIWKRLQSVPDQVDDLTKRIVDLEEKLNGKWPGEVCKICGERALRLSSTNPTGAGKIHQDWKCQQCGQYESRIV